jgi:uncharacterized protein YfaS (alpha-2-macroglobulin family)
MRKHLVILLLFFIPFCAKTQSTDTTFKQDWIYINKLITEKKLPKSALIKLEALYKKAKAQNLPMQQMKALLYKFSLEDEVNNKDVNQEVTFWKKELLNTAHLPSKAIIQLMLAKTYCNEYNYNSWKYNNRTTIVGYKPTDATTWTKQNFTTTIDTLLQAMLANAKALQQVKLKELDAILIKGEVKEARPTLFDLLAFEAIDCYTKLSSEDEHVSEVDTLVFAKQELFVKHPFKKDSISYIPQVLQLFQQVILFHKNDIDAIALIDADLQRLVWGKTNMNVEKTTNLYQTALEQLIRKYEKNIATDEAVYLLAILHQEKANNYQPNEDTTNRYENVVALQIIQKRLAEQPKASYGRSKLLRLQDEILQKQISSQIEAVNVPNQPFRLYVKYKNTDTLFYRIIKLHPKWGLHNDGDTYWNKLAKLPFITSGFQSLPVTKDYQQHAVELKMDALPIGHYMILASTGKNFIDSTDRLFTQFFQVSQLSYIQNGKDYFVLDRETGKPISNVTIQAKTEKWTNGKSVSSILDAAITNKNGFANLSKIIVSNEYNMSFQFIKEKDTLNSNSIYNYSYDKTIQYKSANEFEQSQAKAFFFLDRSIYRPGQTLYYKALLTTNDSTTGTNKLYISQKPITVYLCDANRKSIDSAKVSANGFGSINGSFKLPLNRLTGEFSLTIKEVNQPCYFNVEEYKRPTFFVEIYEQASTYKINDSITVTGTIKAYAGNVLNNTKVSYVVNRNTRFIPYWGYRKRTGSEESKQITQGSLITKDNGTFEFKFKALASKEIDSSAVFDFSISITATDVNGETREESSKVSVGYKSLLLEAELADVNESNQLKTIPIIATNLNNNKVSAQVKVSVFPLQTPSLPTRKRYWNAPDQFVLSEADFKQAFPFDAYREEDDHTKWKQLALLEQDSIQTIKEAAYTFKKPLPQGWYAIELLAKDSLGNETRNTVYTQVFEATASALPAPTNDWERKNKTNACVGDTASLLIGSSLQDVFVIANTKRKKGNEQIKSIEEDSYQFFQLNNSKKLWQQTVTENDRSGLGLFYAFVKHNRFYQGGSTITIPYNNKQLNIHYATYRNKTEPGSKETWSIQIKGSNKELAAAELVTSMYDASLDQFKPHDWNKPSIWNNNTYFRNNWHQGNGFDDKYSNENVGRSFDLEERDKYTKLWTKDAGQPLWWLNPLQWAYADLSKGEEILRGKRIYALKTGRGDNMGVLGGLFSVSNASNDAFYFKTNSDRKIMYMPAHASINNLSFTGSKIIKEKNADGVLNQVYYTSQDEIYVNAEKIKKSNSPKIQPRKNFSETAFFFPALYADTAGNYSFSFTMPESLTQWKWLSFAHTKDLAFGSNSTTITTQKTLMVQPNAPRFLREGDNLEFVAKISNLSDKELTGQATLALVDATTGNSVDGWFQNSFPVQYFTASAGQSTVVKFPLQVPFNYNKPLTWKVIARAEEFSDGEENTLPVLSNRILVTETLPLYLKPNEQAKSFQFNALLNNNSESLTHESITVEYTANPLWSIVQALPYLMEYPYECAEQTFNRLFANTMAASIVDKHPKIKAQFEKWRNDTTLVKSNLQLNEELKQVLLQETPWVLNAANEQQQQKNIALLFDVVKMSQNIESIIEKLRQLQTSNGSFAWFKGGNDSRYITNYILTGIGKIKMMQSLTQEQGDKLYPIFSKALAYMDDELSKDYKKLISNKQDVSKPQIGSSQIEYLYMRSFFAAPIKNWEAYNYYYNQAKQFWNKQNAYHAAMIALVLHRNNERRFVNVNILPSLLEKAIEDTAKGTLYWKNQQTCFWYQSPIEHQAMMINVIHEIAVKEGMTQELLKVDEAKTWLLLNKQANDWNTTIATADACYAVLNTGNNWLANSQTVQIKLGSQIISSKPNQTNGFIKQRIDGTSVKAEMGNIAVRTSTVNNTNSQPSYGAVYWQYFEDLDKIKPTETPLSITKKIFIEKNTAQGKQLQLVTDTSTIKVGDKLMVRMELHADRNMQYLHLKDMRASGTEPINVLSGYKWQDVLGYYEVTKDASTNFFIDAVQKGTYVFEYPLYITHVGTFSVGLATIQCMYAPEFTSHSQSIKLVVKE